MFGLLLSAVGLAVLYAVVRGDRSKAHRQVVRTVLAAYVLRLLLQTFVRYIPFFSHGLGGDYLAYEWKAGLLATVWRHTGWHYVRADELDLGETTLPANVFGTVIYLNGEPTRLGCTALVAVCACLACYNLYQLAIELGADEPYAFRILLLTIFAPCFLMYTSDMFKDGFVAFLAIGAVASSFRLARRFSLQQAALGALFLVGLWQVRFYLVFVTLGPLFVGFFGLTARSAWRPIVAAIALLAVGLFVATYTDVLTAATEKAVTTFNNVDLTREGNTTGGSAVVFDDGGRAFGAFGPKLLYTLFSPFPWSTGSVGLQIGKLDAMIWYYLAYRAFRATRILIREQLGLLLMFAAFLVPTTVMYATSMANMGLIARQRLPIVLVAALLATLSRPKVTAPKRETDSGSRPAIRRTRAVVQTSRSPLRP